MCPKLWRGMACEKADCPHYHPKTTKKGSCRKYHTAHAEGGCPDGVACPWEHIALGEEDAKPLKSEVIRRGEERRARSGERGFPGGEGGGNGGFGKKGGQMALCASFSNSGQCQHCEACPLLYRG